jgi:hypothetical protein
MKRWFIALFIFLVFVGEVHVGREIERRKIADAIRSGRLTVNQNIEHLAQEIEGKRPWVAEER